VSDSTHWTYASAGHSPYAPKWARDPCARRHSQLRTADLAEDSTGRAEEGIGSILARAGDPLRPETNPSVNHFLERSLQPDIVPYPWSTASSPFNAVEIVCGSIIGVAAGVAITLLMIGKVPPAGSIAASDSTGAAPFAARFAGQPSAGGQIGPAAAFSNNPAETSPERRM
jgi:hypothetical protein